MSSYGVSTQEDAVVTGEAVALDLRVARAGSRALAFVIDATAVTVLLVVSVVVVGHMVSGTSPDPALVAALLLAVFVGCFVGWPVAIEALTRGRSLGKLALGLRVVRDDGGPIRFRQSFVRGLAGLFELYLFTGVPALITSLSSRQGKRVGDYLAGTIVLQERVPARTAPPVQMPPPLAAWAAGADLSGVTDSLALAARQFMGRANQLRPQARAQLEWQLAGSIAAVVAPQPPAETPAWAMIAAVLAERRRRDELRHQEAAPGVTSPAADHAPPRRAAPAPEADGFTPPS